MSEAAKEEILDGTGRRLVIDGSTFELSEILTQTRGQRRFGILGYLKTTALLRPAVRKRTDDQVTILCNGTLHC